MSKVKEFRTYISSLFRGGQITDSQYKIIQSYIDELDEEVDEIKEEIKEIFNELIEEEDV